MSVPEKVRKALNKQLAWEFYSAYLYLSMSAYFESKNLKGFAHWMKKQAEEETMHAMKIFNYLAEKKARIHLLEIQEPRKEWENAEAAIENALMHEKGVTKRIHSLVELASKEKDHETKEFLQWFVKEQVEEENTASRVLQKTRSAGSKKAMEKVDFELGQRK